VILVGLASLGPPCLLAHPSDSGGTRFARPTLLARPTLAVRIESWTDGPKGPPYRSSYYVALSSDTIGFRLLMVRLPAVRPAGSFARAAYAPPCSWCWSSPSGL